MKKYFNRALFYQYFYTGKWAILLGTLIFSIVTYGNVSYLFQDLKYNISTLVTNHMGYRTSSYLFVVCIILFGIYILMKGFNKRNNMSFLMGCPFSREEIKRNELLFLFTTLLFFILLFIYLNLCYYFSHKEVLAISTNYIVSLVNDTIRLFFVGSIFIVYLSFMDMLFSNLIFSIICMIGMPIVIIYNLAILLSLVHGFNIGQYIPNILEYIMDLISCIAGYFMYGIVEPYYYNLVINRRIGIIIIFLTTIICILIGLFLIKNINKKITENKTNKFFTFPIVRDILIVICSFSLVNVISNIIILNNTDRYTERFYTIYPEYITSGVTPFSQGKGILYFILSIISIIIVTAILSKIVNKAIKKIV